MVVQGQRKDMGEEELKKMKEESVPFPELNLLETDVTLEGDRSDRWQKDI